MITDALHWFSRPKESAEEQERSILAAELEETRRSIHRTYLQFNSTGDPDLIDSTLYEINSLQARHSYLLRRLKALEGIGEVRIAE